MPPPKKDKLASHSHDEWTVNKDKGTSIGDDGDVVLSLSYLCSVTDNHVRRHCDSHALHMHLRGVDDANSNVSDQSNNEYTWNS